MSQVQKSRITYLWYLLLWVTLLFVSIIVYHSLTESYIFRFSPETFTLIDTSYAVVFGILSTIIVTNIVGIIFNEIKYTLATEHIIIRKFLPTLRFTILFIVWMSGSFLTLESMKVNTTGLLTGAGIGGAIFALASKDIIANLLGSLSIILSKMFEIGEMIRIKGTEGIVEEISLNNTKIMSSEGKVIYIPNRIITNEQVENLTRRRFFTYIYKIPFKKASQGSREVHDTLMLIEGKISEYFPIDTEITTEIPNANDFVYIFTVKVPEENREFDREIREFLIPYIFPENR